MFLYRLRSLSHIGRPVCFAMLSTVRYNYIGDSDRISIANELTCKHLLVAHLLSIWLCSLILIRSEIGVRGMSLL